MPPVEPFAPASRPFGPLLSAAWLRAHSSEPDVRVLDLRWYLTGKKGADEYARGHIPGAVFIDLAEITAPEGPGRHPIPDASRFEQAMRKAGVSRHSRVVVYDDAGGSIAARLWWLLGYFGHAGAAVLDGGIGAWSAAGGALEAISAPVEPGDFVARAPARERVVDKAFVAARRDEPRVVLLDARAGERFRGESEPVDARAGHIPGARSAPWAGNVRADGTMLAPDALRARYAALGVGDGAETVVYCGSGVTACHDLLALELAGFGSARLYEGSWSEWSRDESLPVETGP